MGFFDTLKAQQIGTKAYKAHSTAMQLRKKKQYDECEQKLNEAMELYEEAYGLGYRRFNFMSGYAVLLMRRGDFAKARDVMLETSKDKALTPEERQRLRVDFSICQWRTGKLDKAIETLERAAGGSKSSLIYNTMGIYLVEQASQTGEFERAEQWMNEAMDYDDEDAETLDNMGQLHMAKEAWLRKNGDEEQAAGEREKALDCMKRAWERKPEQITSAYFYARMLHEDGKDDAAREALSTIRGVPVSQMVQISSDMVESLEKELF